MSDETAAAEMARVKAALEREKKRKAGRTMQRTLNAICNKKYTQAWTCWVAKNAALVKAAKVMQRCLNAICNAALLGGWDQWHGVLESERAAGQVMLRCLNRICNAYEAGGFGQWVAVVDDAVAQESMSETEALRAQLEAEKRLGQQQHAARTMQHTLNRICNAKYTQAFDFWQAKNAALVKAAATGSAVDGGATMLGFGAGTAGALLSIGLFAAGIQRRFSRYGTRVAAVAMIAAGLFVAWRGTMSIPVSGTGGPACHVQHRS